MQYLLLIYGTEGTGPEPGTDAFDAYIGEYQTFTDSIAASNRMLGGEALESVTTAKSIQVRNGDVLVTDGPFAETKEQLGGYYLVEADGLDAAIEMASRIPDAKTGTVEVRPIMTFE